MAQTADEFESLRAEIARLLAAASRERTFHARQMHDEQRRHDAQVAEMLDGYDDETKRVMDAVRSMIDVGEAPAADVQRIHDETVADLQRTLAASDVIGQAKGIIMVTMHCTADAAFDLLRDQSQLEQRTLRDVAADIANSVKSRVAARSSAAQVWQDQ